MKNRRIDKIFSYFPEDLGFVKNPNDPLNIILSSYAEWIRMNEERIRNNALNLYLNRVNPSMPYKIYYQKVEFYKDGELDMDKISYKGTARIDTIERTFLNDDISGIGRNDNVTDPDYKIYVSGIPSPSGISFGFDWDESELYLSDGAEFIYRCVPSGDIPIVNENVDIHPSAAIVEESRINTELRRQSYETTDVDEYLEFQNIPVVIREDWNTSEQIDLELNGYVTQDGVKVLYEVDGIIYDNAVYTVTPGLEAVSVISIEPLEEPSLTPPFSKGDPHYDRDVELIITYNYKYVQLQNQAINNENFFIFDILDIQSDQKGKILEKSVELEEETIFGDYILHNNIVYLDTSKSYLSRYIVEYDYIEPQNIYGLTQESERHFIGNTGNPIYQTD